MYPVATQLICSITSIVTIGYIILLRGNLGLKVGDHIKRLGDHLLHREQNGILKLHLPHTKFGSVPKRVEQEFDRRSGT